MFADYFNKLVAKMLFLFWKHNSNDEFLQTHSGPIIYKHFVYNLSKYTNICAVLCNPQRSSKTLCIKKVYILIKLLKKELLIGLPCIAQKKTNRIFRNNLIYCENGSSKAVSLRVFPLGHDLYDQIPLSSQEAGL